MNGKEKESTRVEQAKTIAKENALEVEEEDNILAKKVGKYKESEREEGDKNYSEKRRQAERDRERMNRQRQREREIQRKRERQQYNDMMTESVVLMSLWPRVINILISN